MNILHTLYDDIDNPWCGGGGALRTWEIARRLSHKHQITILSGAYPNAPQRRNPRRRTHPPRGIRPLVPPQPNELCPLCLPRNRPRKHRPVGPSILRLCSPLRIHKKKARQPPRIFPLHGRSRHRKISPCSATSPAKPNNAPCAFIPHILTISPTVNAPA